MSAKFAFNARWKHAPHWEHLAPAFIHERQDYMAYQCPLCKTWIGDAGSPTTRDKWEVVLEGDGPKIRDLLPKMNGAGSIQVPEHINLHAWQEGRTERCPGVHGYIRNGKFEIR